MMKHKERKFQFLLAGMVVLAALTGQVHAASPTVEKMVSSEKLTTRSLGVIEAKSKVQTGQKVVVEGRVKDFIPGSAVFILTDTSMKSCKDNGEACPTPWDYCCNSKEVISRNSATIIAVSDAKSKLPIKEEIKGVKGIDHLVPVAIEGTSQRDKAGNLIVYAQKINVLVK